MDVNSVHKLCRLCLETTADPVNVFEMFRDSTIASILAKHFWFQVNEDDEMSWLCRICWTQTKRFHYFYKKIQFRHGHFRILNDLDSCIEQEPRLERNGCTRDEALELDMNLVKEENCEYNDDKSCDGSEQSPISDEIGDDCSIDAMLPSESCNAPSPTEKEQQDVQIREMATMKCEICTDDVGFDNMLNAKRHYRSVHKIEGYLMCCGKKYRQRHLILDHIHIHHVNPDAYRCDQCGKRFKQEFRLRIHIDNHAPLDSRAHKCCLCSSSFVRPSLLRAHVKSKHESKTGEEFPCEKCGKIFRSSLLLSCHIRWVHEFSLQHICEVCARSFKTKQLLQKHIFCEHSATPKVQCNVCGAWLKHEFSLRNHLRRYHDSSVKAVSVNCPTCNKEVQSKQKLAAHIRCCHAERKHQCTICDKSFKRAVILKEHIALHTGVDLYSCPYCDRTFKSNANMYSHRKKAHPAEWTRDRTEKNGPSETETTAKNVDE